VGSGHWAVWLTRRREAAKEGAKGGSLSAFFEYEYEYRPPGRTEYEYEVTFLGDRVFAFFVLVLEFCTFRTQFARWRLRSSGFPARALCCTALPVLTA